jgi:hypothetical protein
MNQYSIGCTSRRWVVAACLAGLVACVPSQGFSEPSQADVDALMQVLAQNRASMERISDYAFDFQRTRVTQDQQDNSTWTVKSSGSLVASRDGVSILTTEISSDQFPDSPRMATPNAPGEMALEGRGHHRQAAYIHDRTKSVKHVGNLDVAVEDFPEYERAEHIGWSTQTESQSPDRTAFAFHARDKDGLLTPLADAYSPSFLADLEYEITRNGERIRLTLTKEKWSNKVIDEWYEFDTARGSLVVDSGANDAGQPKWRKYFDPQLVAGDVWFPTRVQSLNYFYRPTGAQLVTDNAEYSEVQMNIGTTEESFSTGMLAALPFQPKQLQPLPGGRSGGQAAQADAAAQESAQKAARLAQQESIQKKRQIRFISWVIIGVICLVSYLWKNRR